MSSGLVNGGGRGKQNTTTASAALVGQAGLGGGLSLSVAPAPGLSTSSSDNIMDTSSTSKISLSSATLKRNPKMELSRSDLLRLLTVLEGELQAREVVIAVLKAEQIKRLLYPSLPRRRDASNKKERVSAPSTETATNVPSSKELLDASNEPPADLEIFNDPYSALLRDSCVAFDPSFDQASTKSIYKLQVRQLGFLLDRQKHTRSYLKTQLEELNAKYNDVFIELEYERQQNREFDRDKTLRRVEDLEAENETLKKEFEALKEHLESERERERKMIVCLLAERKQLIVKLIDEKHNNAELVQVLGTEKSKISEMVEGLEEESKRSLQMELDLERLGSEYESQKDMLKEKLIMSESRNLELETEVEKLRHELDLAKSSRSPLSAHNLGEGVRSTIVASSANSRVAPSISSVAAVNQPKASLARSVSPSKSVTTAPGLSSAPSVTVASLPTLHPTTTNARTAAVTVPGNQTTGSSYATTASPTLAMTTTSQPLSTTTASAMSTPAAAVLNPTMEVSKAVAIAPARPSVANAIQTTTSTHYAAETPTSTSTIGILNTKAPVAKVASVELNTIANSLAPGLKRQVSASAATTASASAASNAPRGAPPPVPPNKPVLPAQVLKERSKELQQAGVVRVAKLTPSAVANLSVAASTKPVTVDQKAGEDTGLNVAHINGGGNSVVSNGAENINSVDMICQELDDFQQLWVSMVSQKNS